MSSDDLESAVVWSGHRVRVVRLAREENNTDPKYVFERHAGEDGLGCTRWLRDITCEPIVQHLGEIAQKATRLQTRLNRLEEANAR